MSRFLKHSLFLANAVQPSEKICQSFIFEVADPGGHSSLPEDDNAIYRLSEALLRVSNHDFPVSLNEVTYGFFERSADLSEGELADAMRSVLRSPPDPAAIAYLRDRPYYNSQLRTTCVATRLDAGPADNALPQRARATVRMKESVLSLSSKVRNFCTDSPNRCPIRIVSNPIVSNKKNRAACDPVFAQHERA